jgi:coenzyme F420-reducing hydrogenase beta subunit
LSTLATQTPKSPRPIIASGLCIGCGGCTTLEPTATMGWDANGHLKPASPKPWPEQDRFAQLCPFSPQAANEDEISDGLFPEAPRDALIGRWAGAYVGHVSEGEYRMGGSSGGMVSWVAAELLRRGLVDGVAHVTPRSREDGDGRLFGYRISRSVEALSEGAKSRYYPVELSEVLREIEAVPGRYAVVGIPCFIKAVNLQRRTNPVIAERVTHTLGLFCGHMKSAKMVDSFAVQLGAEPEQVAKVDYRLKNADRPANWYTAHLTLKDGSTRQQDWFHLVDGDWGSGFWMNSACNFCDDVVAETADIAFGDAWVEPYSSDGKGTNVVITRSPLMQALVSEGIAQGRLALDAVDNEFVRQTQAAGFRQRREGLAYRLARARLPVQPKKRVGPSLAIPARRKLIYRMRQSISRWSHRAFRLAQGLDAPQLYVRWGKAALAVYQGLAYSRGRVGQWVDRVIDPKKSGTD